MGSCRHHFPVRILCSIWVCVVFQPFGVGQRLTLSDAHGAWFLGSIKRKSTLSQCAQGQFAIRLQGQENDLKLTCLTEVHPPPSLRTGYSDSYAPNSHLSASEILVTSSTSVRIPSQTRERSAILTWAVFAIFNLAFIPVVYFLYPETANRTLEDLDDYFDTDSPHSTIIRFGDKVAKQHHRPAEAIEAEGRRIESANFVENDMIKGVGKQFVEHVEVAGS